MHKLQNLCILQVGDYYDDGHGKYDSIIISSNYSQDTILTNFEKARKKLKFNIKDYCQDYEDGKIPLDILKKTFGKELINNLLNDTQNDMDAYIDGDYDEDDEGAVLNCSPVFFAQLYLETIKKFDSMFEYQILDIPSIDIGGYGLFH